MSNEKERLQGQIDSYEREKADAIERRKDEPAFEEVQVKSPKLADALYDYASMVMQLVLLGGGISMMAVTLASLILQSDKLPFAYEYPFAVIAFAFLPLGMMVLIAQTYNGIKSEKHRTLYVWALFLINTAVVVSWLLTLGPAYAEIAVDLEDLGAEAPFDFFSLHITIQLFGEVVIGGLLKIGLHLMDCRYRKTVPMETTSRQCERAHISQIDWHLKKPIAELAALVLHRSAHNAALQSHQEDYSALLARKRAEQLQRDASIEAAGLAAKANHKFELYQTKS